MDEDNVEIHPTLAEQLERVTYSVSLSTAKRYKDKLNDYLNDYANDIRHIAKVCVKEAMQIDSLPSYDGKKEEIIRNINSLKLQAHQATQYLKGVELDAFTLEYAIISTKYKSDIEILQSTIEYLKYEIKNLRYIEKNYNHMSASSIASSQGHELTHDELNVDIYDFESIKSHIALLSKRLNKLEEKQLELIDKIRIDIRLCNESAKILGL